jgi:TRAP-type C4-dicarboxylate transport system permease large subunit
MMVLIAVLYLLVGMAIDMAPAILLIVPVLFPVVVKLGIDPVHFGVVTIVSLSIGLITPPTAPTLAISSRMAEIRIDRTFIEIIPFIAVMSVVLFLVVLFPSLSLWLPKIAK